MKIRITRTTPYLVYPNYLFQKKRYERIASEDDIEDDMEFYSDIGEIEAYKLYSVDADVDLDGDVYKVYAITDTVEEVGYVPAKDIPENTDDYYFKIQTSGGHYYKIKRRKYEKRFEEYKIDLVFFKKVGL